MRHLAHIIPPLFSCIRAGLLGALPFGLAGIASAATLIWDVTSGDGATTTDGAGSWTTGAGNWNTGAGDTTWNNGTPDSAVFGSGGSGSATVTLGGAIIAGGITFNAGPDYTLGGNTITLSGTPALTTAAGVTATIGSTLVGGTNYSKAGTGTLVLTGANTNTGTLSIGAGTVQVGEGGASGQLNNNAGAVSVAASSTLAFFRNNTSQVTYSNPISGAGNLVFLGTGTSNQSQYALGGNNSSFTGSITLNQSRLAIDNANDVGSASAIVVNNGSSVFHTAGTIARPLTLNGNGWLEPTAPNNLGALRFAGGAIWSGAITLGSDSRIYTHSTGDSGTITGSIGDGASTFGIEKNGQGTVFLSGGNTFDGVTTHNRGNLVVRTNTALGSTVGGTVVNGNDGATATNLRLNALAGTLTISEAITLVGNASGRAQLVNETSGNILNGDVTLSGNTNALGIYSNSGTFTINGNISGAFNNSLQLRGSATGVITGDLNIPGASINKTDAATWTIGDGTPSTYAWTGLTAAVGITRMGANNVMPPTSTLTIGQGDTATPSFDLNGFDQTIGALTSNIGSSGAKTVTSGAAGAVLTVNNPGASTYGGVFTGGNNLELFKTGVGTLSLTGNYTAGTVTVDDGILAINSTSGDGFNPASKDILVNSGGTLRYDGGNKIQNNVRITIASGGTFNLNGQSDVIGQLAGAGNILMSGGLTLDGYANPSTQDFSGLISGGGALTLRSITGTQELSHSANTYTGKTILNGGTLLVATGSESTLGNPTLAADALSFNGGSLRIATNDLTLDDANRGITINASGGTFNVDANRTLSVAKNISGASGQLNKAGAGTFNLTAGTHALGSINVTAGTFTQSGGTVNTPSGTVGGSGTYRLAGGKLRLDALNISGGFDWTGGTLTHYTTGTSSPMALDQSSVGFQEVGVGRTATVTGDLSSGAGAVLALHGSPTLYESLGIRFNNFHVIGALALAGVGDVLEMELNPYLLRPFSTLGEGAVEYGSLPLLTWTGAFDGNTFDSVTGIVNDGRGFELSTFGVVDGSALDINTYFLEYDAAAQTLWFHYKVNGYVPEPDTFALLALSVIGLRTARTLRERRARLA